MDREYCEACRIPALVASGSAETFERSSCHGRERLERVAVYPLCKSAGSLDGAIIQITDITETKSLERQLFQREKLASLGLLVSGVAHEINNPNGFITFNLPILRNYIATVMDRMPARKAAPSKSTWFGMSFDEFHKDLFQLIDNLEHGAQRIAKIVASMNSLARPKTLGHGLRECRIARLVDQVETLCKGELKRSGQQLTIRCPNDLPAVLIDVDALEQVLINLLMNAAQAGGKAGGMIELNIGLSSDSRLEIRVRDDGSGMEEAIREKIFDPFFTTKSPGEGTGLGLAISHSLVVSMGGTIKCESRPGSGSTFRIEVPVTMANDRNTQDSERMSRSDQNEGMEHTALRPAADRQIQTG